MSTPHIFRRPAHCPWVAGDQRAEIQAKKAIVLQAQQIENLLKSNGSDVNSLNIQGVPLIQLMVQHNKPLDLAAVLVLGADIDVLDQSRNGLLHLALQKDYDGDLASRVNQLQCVQLLIGYGLKPNFANEDGNTPFHFAVQYGAATCVDPLLAADNSMINAQNNDGKTAEQLAELEDFS